MPATTNYAIPFPCEGDVITPAVFQQFAMGVESAISTVTAAGVTMRHTPNATASGTNAAAVGVETIITYTGGSQYTSGITFNAAAGTFTIITPGLYNAGALLYTLQSTLTMTSSRCAVYVNGVYQFSKKYRGNNPADITTLGGSFSGPILLAVGDVVTFRYLWTGTGALSLTGGPVAFLSLLATP